RVTRVILLFTFVARILGIALASGESLRFSEFVMFLLEFRWPVSFGAYGDERVVGIIARAVRATKEREVQGQSGVKRKLFGSCKDNIGWNMRYRRWMELFSEYGCETKYNMGKENEVVDAGSRKDGVKPRRVRDICKTV
nr:putative reverse transcriptase domain-containing protein [Tanacetum cinerariifolium]